MDFLTANTQSVLNGEPNGSSSPPRAKMSSSSAAATPARTASAPPCGTAAAAWSNWKSCPSRPCPAPRTIPGRSGRKSIDWITARKRRWPSSAAIRASTARPPRNSSATSTATSKKSIRSRSTGRRTRRAGSSRSRFPEPRRSRPRRSCCWRWVSSGRRQPLLEQLGVERDAAPMSRRNTANMRPACPGVFAAGDARRGQSLVVWAFNEGRGAARECDRYLMGETNLP